MAESIPTSLTGVVNESAVRGAALVALINQYSTIQTYLGFRTIGSQDVPISFPCIMVEPSKEKFWMPALGKTRLEIWFNIYWYCQESNPESIVRLDAYIGAFLRKLFSNNALNDISGAHTAKFKTYPNGLGGYNWLDSDYSDITYSTSYINSTPDNQTVYLRGGFMQFHIIDQFVA